MGHSAGVTHAQSRMDREPGKRLTVIRDRHRGANGEVAMKRGKGKVS